MKTDKDTIDKLIAECLSTGSDPRQTEELRQWLDLSADNRRYFEGMKQVWLTASSAGLSRRYDADRAFSVFKSRVAGLPSETGGAPAAGLPVRKAAVTLLRFAAAVAIVVAIGIAAYMRGGSDVRGNFADITIEAPMGSTSRATLPDGTEVTLNAGSRLTYSQGYGIVGRDVRLNGEALFDVRHDAAMPFSVITDKLDLKVLGTRFNFRCYDNEQDITVALLRGSVALENKMRRGACTMLKPGEMAIFNKVSGDMRVSRISTSRPGSWVGNGLNFEEESLERIARTLERSYNVKINISSDSLRRYRFYGMFNSREQTVEDVLNALSATGKVRYKRHGRHITIY